MSFELLLLVQTRLDEDLISGFIDINQWTISYSTLLTAAGLTEKQYEIEIDLRWNNIDKLRTISKQLILC